LAEGYKEPRLDSADLLGNQLAGGVPGERKASADEFEGAWPRSIV